MARRISKRPEKNRKEKASELVGNLGVKLHIFKPSEREIWTVVGKEGDFLVDEDPNTHGHAYCSCGDFHFRVLSGMVPECYHLIAFRQAKERSLFDKIEFSDEEYESFLGNLVKDIFAQIS
jgi:predicted nucleic acid-binding Zn finger protein